jgi:hypothetical protein
MASAFAAPNNMNNTKNTKIIKATANEIVYTYEQDGKKYKNIDHISSDQKSVNSEIYLLKGSDYILVDTIDSHIKGDTMTIHSNKSNSYDEVKLRSLVFEVSTSSYDWTYHDSYDGDTSVKNLTIGAAATAIAIALCAITGMPWYAQVVIGVATYLFDKSLTTAYFHVYQYIDNSQPLRPAYKDIAYFYEDKYHNEFIEYVVQIFDTNE